MKTPFVYLSGPMQGLTTEQMADWRHLATQRLRDNGLGVYNPVARSVLQTGARKYMTTHEEALFIVCSDKQEIENSDYVLVNATTPPPFSFPYGGVGTSMEVLFAHQLGKKVVVACPEKPMEMSPWLRYHSHAIFPTIEQAVEYIVAETRP